MKKLIIAIFVASIGHFVFAEVVTPPFEPKEVLKSNYSPSEHGHSYADLIRTEKYKESVSPTGVYLFVNVPAYLWMCTEGDTYRSSQEEYSIGPSRIGQFYTEGTSRSADGKTHVIYLGEKTDLANGYFSFTMTCQKIFAVRSNVNIGIGTGAINYGATFTSNNTEVLQNLINENGGIGGVSYYGVAVGNQLQNDLIKINKISNQRAKVIIDFEKL